MSKQSKDNTINLEDYRAPNAKVFTGRDRGRDARIRSNIDSIADEFDTVQIIIPDNVYSIIPSFFEELLLNVVQKYGKEGFFAKFIFQSLGDYKYERALNEAIDRILRKEIAID